MKKITIVICLTLLTALALVGCSCSSSSSLFIVESNGQAGITITAKNADASASGTGSITVEENQKVVFDASTLTAGKLKMEFKSAADKELPSASVRAKESSIFDMPAGEYDVVVSVEEKADGSAKITTEGK